MTRTKRDWWISYFVVSGKKNGMDWGLTNTAYQTDIAVVKTSHQLFFWNCLLMKIDMSWLVVHWVSGVDKLAEGTNTLYHAYYGIPFAQPPVGDLRFKAPERYRGNGPNNIVTTDRWVYLFMSVLLDVHRENKDGDQIWVQSGQIGPNGTNLGLFQIRIQYILACFISYSAVARVTWRSRAILTARRHRSEAHMSPRRPPSRQVGHPWRKGSVYVKWPWCLLPITTVCISLKYV